MISLLLGDLMADELYLSGEPVSSGTYREVGTDRQIQIEQGDRLPPAPDGSATAYVCLNYIWKSLASYEGRQRRARE